MVYLTDDFKGGEECFPFADNETFSQKVTAWIFIMLNGFENTL